MSAHARPFVLSILGLLGAAPLGAGCKQSPCAEHCDRGAEAERCMALSDDDSRARCIQACVAQCELPVAAASAARASSTVAR